MKHSVYPEVHVDDDSGQWSGRLYGWGGGVVEEVSGVITVRESDGLLDIRQRCADEANEVLLVLMNENYVINQEQIL